MDIIALVLAILLCATIAAFGVMLWQSSARKQETKAAQEAHAATQHQLRGYAEAHAALQEQYRGLAAAHAAMQNQFHGVIDAQAERQRVLGMMASERASLQAEFDRSKASWDEALRSVQAQHQQFVGIVDAHAERQRVLGGIEGERARAQGEFDRAKAGWDQAIRTLQGQHQHGQGEVTALRAAIAKARAELNLLDEEANLRAFGFYKPRYDFASSDKYEARLDQIRDRQKVMLKDKTAATCSVSWTVNGNAAEGRKQINQTLKLMLRGFNGECDASIAKVKYNNIQVMEGRIRKSFDDIIGLAAVQQCVISPIYLGLKLEELYLAHEFKDRVQSEKEEQRRIREQMREEEAAQREIDKRKVDAEKEEQRYAAALAKAREDVERASGAKQAKLLEHVQELELRLAAAQQNTRAVAQAQLTRTGHVYIISNVGSFGDQIYKIGMTRRLDPQDRVDELGDASVPFEFDVHAMIRAQDAPALENALHRLFHSRRVNRVNVRKEFFRVTLDEIITEVAKLHGEVEVTRLAEAKEYRQTMAMVEAGQSAATPPPSAVYAETPSPSAARA
jgi:type II secretory pathway pseudopilin PulG